jgi:uncharacterized protein
MRKPFSVMVKPVGPICNLDCTYCYYLEKEALYPGRESWRMDEEVLREHVRQFIESQDIPEVQFTWQGGEPTLLGVEFFKKAVALQKEYANGRRVTNALQTNGTLLDDEWCRFFAENQFLIGISVDGPAELHDAYRVDKRGRPTHASVMRGVELLHRHRVEFNTLTVVHRLNSRHPLEVYRFLKGIGSTFLQFIPLVERKANPDGLLRLASPLERSEDPEVTEWSVLPEEFGSFLIAIFDSWVRSDVGRTYVQIFDVALGQWANAGASLCVFAETCGAGVAMEHNGDVYACDHYVYPEYRLGNIRETPLRTMLDSDRQRAFGQNKKALLPRQCRECDVRFACNGECPKHRFVRTADGEPGLNYLCAGYQAFFRHIRPHMETMADLLRQQKAPASIMAMLAEQELSKRPAGVGRNDPCPCGSGQKFKKCCGRG